MFDKLLIRGLSLNMNFFGAKKGNDRVPGYKTNKILFDYYVVTYWLRSEIRKTPIHGIRSATGCMIATIN